jgi:hypothetical protein
MISCAEQLIRNCINYSQDGCTLAKIFWHACIPVKYINIQYIKFKHGHNLRSLTPEMLILKITSRLFELLHPTFVNNSLYRWPTTSHKPTATLSSHAQLRLMAAHLISSLGHTPRVSAGSFCEIWKKYTNLKFGSRHTKMISSYSYMLRKIEIKCLYIL